MIRNLLLRILEGDTFNYNNYKNHITFMGKTFVDKESLISVAIAQSMYKCIIDRTDMKIMAAEHKQTIKELEWRIRKLESHYDCN